MFLHFLDEIGVRFGLWEAQLARTKYFFTFWMSCVRFGLWEVYLNTNLVLSDSGATLKFKFCTLKNTTHTDFQLKISTPGILAAIRSFGKIL